MNMTSYVIGVGLGYILAWMGLVYRDLWKASPILIPDPDFPGRHKRHVSETVRRDAKGHRFHG